MRSAIIERRPALAVLVLIVCFILGVFFAPHLFHSNRLANIIQVQESGSNQTYSEFGLLAADTVMAPRIANVHLNNQSLLPDVLERLRPDLSRSLSRLFHGMHLYGANVKVLNGANQEVSATDFICNATLTAAKYDDRQVLGKTRQGLRFPLVYELALSTDQSNVQAHLGQGLAVLASSGVPINQEVRLASGETWTVRAIIDDCLANFLLEGEIYWDAVALAIYLPPNRLWHNKFGDQFSFDQLVVELMRRSPGESSCGGTHGLIALTTILRADAESPILSEPIREELHQHLGKAVSQLKSTYSRVHGWSLDWWESKQNGGKEVTARESIVATGHHLEWLIMLPVQLQPNPQLLKDAAERLLERLWTATEDESWVEEEFCPAVHAARSVWILSDLKTPLMMEMQAFLKVDGSRVNKHDSIRLVAE